MNKFGEESHEYFGPFEDLGNYRFDLGNEYDLAEDVDPQSLIKLVQFLKRGKVPGATNSDRCKKFISGL